MSPENPSASFDVSPLPILRIRWQLQFTRCNLNCPYCIAEWTKRPVEFDVERFNRIVDRLLDLPYRLVVRLGVEGEIFLSREIQEGVIRLSHHPKVEGVSFSTNLVVPMEKIQGFLDRADLTKVGLGATIHDTQIDDVEEFFRKVAAIHHQGVLMYVGYVGIPDLFEKIRTYKARLDDLGVPFILNEYNGAMQGLPYPENYSGEERAFLREHFWSEHYYKMLVERKSPRGKPCLAGHRYIYIGKDGTVLNCGMDRNRAWSLLQKALWRINREWPKKVQAGRVHRRRLGNILDGLPKLSDHPRICPHPRCDCGNEVQAMCCVTEHQHRTRTLRVIYPKDRAADFEARYPNLRPVPNDIT